MLIGPMQPVFLEGVRRPLLIVHALIAFACLGAATHLAIVSIHLLQGRTHLWRLARIYSQVIGGTFGAAFGAGLLLYPSYRYHVRALYLDRFAPWASNLFDIKENLLALALPLAACLFFAGRSLDGKSEAPLAPALVYLSCSLWVLVASGAVLGLLVTAVKGV